MQGPDVAIAALTAQLAGKLLIDGYSACTAAATRSRSVPDTHDTLASEAQDMKEEAAWQALDAERKVWLALIPGSVDALLPWVLLQDAATVSRLLTFLVATTVTDVCGTEPEKHTTDGSALALGLDMSKWRRATATSYFSHVSKVRIGEVVTQAVGAQAAAALQPLKKEGAAKGAETAEAATRWMPTIMRLRSPDADVQPCTVTSSAESKAAEPQAATA